MHARLTLLLLSVVFLLPVAQAQKLYKWVDKDGRVSYHDQPPPADRAVRVEEKSLRTDTTGAADNDTAAKSPVVLYSTPKCNSCDLARQYLQKRRVPFTEKNVDGDRQLQDELIKQAGGLAVPTLVVGTKVMRGYLESLLEGELDQAGYPPAPAPEQAAAP